MSCQEKFVAYMHDYLDGDLSEEHVQELKEHLQTCPECEQHFKELKKTIALVQGTSGMKSPDDFTANVMANLPKQKKKVKVNRWLKNHPLLSAASLFLILMVGSITFSWDQEEQFSYSKYADLVVENGTVIVPEGEVIEGDLVVRNGKVQIEGEVHGDVTVINGEQYLAAAGKVTGDISEVNEIFEWIWYHMKNTVKKTVNLINEDKQSLND